MSVEKDNQAVIMTQIPPTKNITKKLLKICILKWLILITMIEVLLFSVSTVEKKNKINLAFEDCFILF